MSASIEDIVKIHKDMEVLVIRHIMTKDHYEKFLIDLEEYTEIELNEMYAWLKGIHEKEYRELHYVWNLLPEKMWQDYEIFNVKGLREQGMLRHAINMLKKVFYTPYRTPKQLERQAQRKSPYKHRRI